MVWKDSDFELGPERDFVFIPLVGMLEMVAFKRGLRGKHAEIWCRVMYQGLDNVGIHTLRDFQVSILSLNEKLLANGWKRVEPEVLQLMVAEVGDMMFGPEHDFAHDLDVSATDQDPHHE
jgi:hypothetical protein